MDNQTSPIIRAILEENNRPAIGIFKFDSNDHIRYLNGIDVSGHNYNCHRQVEIKNNINGGEGYTVTIYNLDGIHPVWGTNVQMAPKQMKIVSRNANSVLLKGFGFDQLGLPFSNYGMTIFFNDEKVEKFILHIFDRRIDIEYLQ